MYSLGFYHSHEHTAPTCGRIAACLGCWGEQGVAVNTTIERPDGSNLYVVYTDSNTHDAPFILILIIIIIIVCILFLRGRTHMHLFSADALSSS